MDRRRLITACAALVVVAGLLCLTSRSALSAPTRDLGDGRLLVEVTHEVDSHLIITLDIPSDRGIPGKITIVVPRGFDLYPDRESGSAVGDVSVVAEDQSYGKFTESTLRGKIVAISPSTTTGWCAPDAPVGLWQMQLSLLGQPLDAPIFLSAAGPADPEGSGAKIELCAPVMPKTTSASPFLLPITSLVFDLGSLAAPSARGSYVWRALVTPLAADRRTPQPAAMYELRALMPVPNRLTLVGRYQARTRTAVLSGRLSANGAPRSRAVVEITALVRRVTASGAVFDDRFVGAARTDAQGRYTLRVPIKKTTGFVARAEDAVRRCTGSTVAPGGCLNTTLPRAESDPITVSIPASS